MMKRKKNTTEGTLSVRRDNTIREAVRMGVGEGFYPLDCYNNYVITDGTCYAITTRISGCNNYFLLEVLDNADREFSPPEGEV